MSNNPNWKRQLKDKINEHNDQHGQKHKGVSNKTMHERACSLFRSFTLLRRLGYQIDPNNLAGRHKLLLRDLAERMKSEPVLSSPATVRDWLRLYCAHLEHEVFLVLHLDARNCLIEAQELFRGTLSQTSVFPREVVKSVLACNAAAVLLVHNHPSGRAEASRADELITQSLRQALALIDVKVLDHFIVAGTNTLSFAESGLI